MDKLSNYYNLYFIKIFFQKNINNYLIYIFMISYNFNIFFENKYIKYWKNKYLNIKLI